jgi:uncharacterized protein involved in exopolysaccharide biosynthesis
MGTKRSFWHARQRDSQEAENMEAPVGIEPSRPPRRLRALLALALSGALGGFLISYLLPPRYTSTSTVLVEGQKVPDNYVAPIITADFAQRVQTLSMEILSPSKLRPMLHGLGVVKPEDEGKLVGEIQQNMRVEPVVTTMSEAVQNSPTAKSASNESVQGFNLVFIDKDPVISQKVCNALAALMMEENLISRSEVVRSTTEFLTRELEEAKRALDEQDAKIAEFKKTHMGQLPTDGRTAMNPAIEEEYKILTRGNDTNEAFYKDLLAKRNAAQLVADMENGQLGEQMHIVALADLPEAPDFPDRSMNALGGMVAALLLGLGRLVWPAARKLFQRLALLFPIGTEIG